jgi:hypothetical protein
MIPTMSARTAPALAKIDALLPRLRTFPAGEQRDQLLDETAALRRAVEAFHMEAIRFRMHSVDRLLRSAADAPSQQLFEELRHELEAAGFHTRSHAAP